MLFGHEGHQIMEEAEDLKQLFLNLPAGQMGRPSSWIEWFGNCHFIFLHFPIALFSIAGLSELLFLLNRRMLFNDASRFMIIVGAFLSLPTAIFGLLFSYTGTYTGLMADFVWLHMYSGFLTVVLGFITAWILEYFGRGKLFYILFILLFIQVNITGFLGGGMTFGPYQMLPPPS